MSAGTAVPGTGGARMFARLARWIVRHPWYPIIFWVVLLVVSLPFLSLINSVTTNSAESTSPNSPSALANAELARLFPNSTSAASTTILLVGPDMTDANGQRVVLNVTTALDDDPSLVDVAAVSSVYTGFTAYLTGQGELALPVLHAAQSAVPSLGDAANETATTLWAPPAMFVSAWEALVPGTDTPQGANYPAYQATAAAIGNNSAELAVLDAYYDGNATNPGWNSTAGCWSVYDDPLIFPTCTYETALAAGAQTIPVLFPTPSEQVVPYAMLDGLDLGNYSSWASVRWAAATTLSAESGLPSNLLSAVWGSFPTTTGSPDAVGAWATAVVANSTLATEPIPVPSAIYTSYVDPAGTAQIVQVSFTVSDSTTNSTGATPVYDDLARIDSLVPGVVRASDATGTIVYYQTGPAPLDQLSQTAINSSIALVLPLTVGLLLVISMVYFRSPMTPLVTFGILGIALALGIGGTVLIGELVTHVDSTAITLEEVFVLGVGTDYSIFMVARYREELISGKSSEDAIVESISWAGQSVATSGSTAIIATLALTFSGVALLSQWGAVLSLAIFITILASLTMVPACLKLLGPRIFWPTTGDRFRRRAAVVAEKLKTERTYFYRVGRATQRRPGVTAGIILLLSIPLILIALQVPLSYDYYAQLPSGHPATIGLNELGDHFGAGFAVPSYALVTFSSPLLVGNQTNATEFTDLAALTAIANSTGGIAAVSSPVGVDGGTLGQWLSLPSLPTATRINLLAVLSDFVGVDGRTVLLSLQPSASGLSVAAVDAVLSVQSSYGAYAGDHPEITAVHFGGGAPTINDLATETATATDYLVFAVAIGLILVLLVVLRSWIIALMAIGTIGISIGWAWAVTYLVFQELLGFPLFFYVRTILFILILGLGIDYNIFLLTRVREERVRGRSSSEAAVEAVARTGGIITAAAIILASAFGALLVGEFTLIRAIGFSVAVAVILDAMVVRTYLVPASLQLLGDRVWSWTGRRAKPTAAEPSTPADPEAAAAATSDPPTS